MEKRTGGCNCGKVRLQVEGNPIRVGVCHCQICRKDTGSSFNFFAVWSAENVTTAGDTTSWMHSTDHRHFCATCGSSLYSVVDGANEVEIRVGALDDAPSGLVPAYELWLNRRESWLRPIDRAEQYAGNRS
jgi:hypothetical protein